MSETRYDYQRWALPIELVLSGTAEISEKPRKRRDRASGAAKDKSSAQPVPEIIAREIFSYLDPECGYSDWRKRLCAIPAIVGDDEAQSMRRQIARDWSAGQIDRKARYVENTPAGYVDDDDVDAVWGGIRRSRRWRRLRQRDHVGAGPGAAPGHAVF